MLDAEKRERAVERLAHQVAACVHAMLATQRMTVADLKAALERLDKGSSEYVDDLLAARNPHGITIGKLADVAFVLGSDWEVRIVPLPQAEELQEPTS